MNQLRVIFAGTPDFAVPALSALHEYSAVDLIAVYTQPDRQAGRGRKVSSSAVKKFAMEHGLPVCQPEHFRDEEALHGFRQLNADVLVVAAYGLILPAEILDSVRFPLNVHASLLPRWRGAAPIQRAIMEGDEETGISIMRVVPELDAGPVWLVRRCPISAQDTGGSLHDRLAALGAEALLEALEACQQGNAMEQPQDDAAATYAYKLTNEDRNIEWSKTAQQIDRTVRALCPFPGARFTLKNESIKLLGGEMYPIDGRPTPGSLLSADAAGLLFATGDGGYRITRLQPAGKKPMDSQAFLNGYGRLL